MKFRLLKDLTISIKTVQKPGKILLQPEGRELKVDYLNGVSRVIIPEIKIHSILEVIQ